MPSAYPLRYAEFEAGNLPEPGGDNLRAVIWRADLKEYHFSDGARWLTMGGSDPNVTAVQYDGSDRVIAYASNGAAHVVTYPNATTIVDTSAHSVLTVTLDEFGRVIASITADL